MNGLSEVHSGWRGFKQKMSLFCRGCWLAAIFIPFMVLAFILYFVSTFLSAYWAEYLQCSVWVMLRYCLEQGGAAFIKWGQVSNFFCTQVWLCCTKLYSVLLSSYQLCVVHFFINQFDLLHYLIENFGVDKSFTVVNTNRVNSEL